MRCVVCRHGETEPGATTVTLERHGLTLVVKQVPARICRNCGEEYVEESVAAQLLVAAQEAERAGVQVDVRKYVSSSATA